MWLMHSKKILVDVDDTIADTQHMLIQRINQQYEQEYVFEEMDRDYREDYESEKTKLWREAVWDILKRPDVMVTAKPSPGAVEAMVELVNHGYSPDIVTARKEILFACTAEWLKNHGFADHVHYVHPRKQGESGVDFKVRIAKEVGFAAAFDDTLEVIIALADVVPVVYAIDKPWNRGHEHEIPDNVMRVESFAAGVQDFLHVNEPAR